MSEKEDFLSRWSRRKQEAAREKPLRDDQATQGVPEEGAESEKLQAALTQDKPDDEPLFDLSKLPSLDSIGPGTDIRVFMQPGVPASLSHAALRRAWSADPAIRDFIGLSENSWDFTKPESITGFGQLLPIDDVKRMLSKVLGDESEPPQTADAPEHTASQHEEASAQTSSDMSQAAAQQQELDTENSVDEAVIDSALQCTQSDLALQQENSANPDELLPPKRRHGSALPT